MSIIDIFTQLDAMFGKPDAQAQLLNGNSTTSSDGNTGNTILTS
jgi:hypothetical protein